MKFSRGATRETPLRCIIKGSVTSLSRIRTEGAAIHYMIYPSVRHNPIHSDSCLLHEKTDNIFDGPARREIVVTGRSPKCR